MRHALRKLPVLTNMYAYDAVHTGLRKQTSSSRNVEGLPQASKYSEKISEDWEKSFFVFCHV